MITGTGEARILLMISRMASITPPGVLSSIRTASSFSAAAWSIARSMRSWVAAWMVSSMTIFKTWALDKEQSKTVETRAVSIVLRRMVDSLTELLQLLSRKLEEDARS